MLHRMAVTGVVTGGVVVAGFVAEVTAKDIANNSILIFGPVILIVVKWYFDRRASRELNDKIDVAAGKATVAADNATSVNETLATAAEKVEEVHQQVKSSNGKTTAQLVEQLASLLDAHIKEATDLRTEYVGLEEERIKRSEWFNTKMNSIDEELSGIRHDLAAIAVTIGKDERESANRKRTPSKSTKLPRARNTSTKNQSVGG